MNGPETQAHADELRSEQMMAASEMRSALLAKPLSRLVYAGGVAIRDAVLRVVWHLGDVILRLDGIREQAEAAEAQRGEIAQGLGLVIGDVRSELDGLNGTALLIAERQTQAQDAIAGGLVDVKNELETTRTQVLLQLVGMLGSMDIMHDQAQGQRSIVIDRLTDLRTQLGGTLHVDLSTLAQRLDLLHADLAALLAPPVPAPLAGTLTGAALNVPFQLAATTGKVERVVFYNTGGGAVEFEVRVGGVRIDHVKLSPNTRETVGALTASGALTVVNLSGTAANYTATQWSVIYR